LSEWEEHTSWIWPWLGLAGRVRWDRLQRVCVGALGAGENKVFLTLSANAASSFSPRILQLIDHQRRAKIAYTGSTNHYVIFVHVKEGEKWYAKITLCTKLLDQVII
jgi:hypothetical protein